MQMPNEELTELVGRVEAETLPEERRYLQIDLLKDAVEPSDQPLLDYVEHVAPRLLEEFSLLTAKGGSGKGHPEWNPKWSENHDQSMLSHILNGIFPTLRIVRQSGQALSDTEERLYLVGYTLHDLDKLTRVRNLSVADVEHKEQFLDFLDDWLTRWNVQAFFPDVDEHREDLAWLILNTQQVWGANRNLPSFDLTLSTRRLNVLQEMCTFSDKIAFFIKQPSDAVAREDIRELLLKLSGGKFEFGYHQIAENKGMLTNVINNTLLVLLRDELGWLPLLFFPTGVVYLRPRGGHDTLPALDTVAQKVEGRLRIYCQQRLEHNLIGFTRDGKGFKFPVYYHQFFPTRDLLSVIATGAFRIVREGKEASAGKRLEKLRQLQQADRSLDDVDLDFDDDLRVDQLAEFLDQVQKIIGAIVGADQVADKILEALDLVSLRTDFLAVPRDNRAGGVPLHWYFAAGKYLRQNTGLSSEQMRTLLDDIARKVCAAFSHQIDEHDKQQAGFTALRDYVNQVVDINAGTNMRRDFVRELNRYEAMKKRSRQSEVGCSLCSSPFETGEQRETEVVFAPQVYTGKRPLGSAKMERGICELCKVELMLRQILLRTRLKLVGGGYENVRIKWLYLYPSYFFTTETAKFARQAYLQLKNLNFFDVRRALRGGMGAQQFLDLDEVVISNVPIAVDDDPLLKMEFDPNDLATFYFCGIPTLGKKPTDTESWAMPTFLGFLMGLVFNAKVVVSESIIPLFASGEEWKETVILDGPHGFVTHLLHNDRFRLDEMLGALRCLASTYDLNIDAFFDSKTKDPNWTRLAGVARHLDTDKFYVFHYLRKWQRKKENREQYGDHLPEWMPPKYLQIYHNIGGENMCLIQGVGERCFKFYEPIARKGEKFWRKFTSHRVLRVVSLLEDVIVNSEPSTCHDDLKLQAVGEVSNLMQRLREESRPTGIGLLRGDPQAQHEAIRDFVEHFYNEVFVGYCEGERALLRDRRNRFNAGVEAWYHENWRRLRDERRETRKEETTDVGN